MIIYYGLLSRESRPYVLPWTNYCTRARTLARTHERTHVHAYASTHAHTHTSVPIWKGKRSAVVVRLLILDFERSGKTHWPRCHVIGFSFEFSVDTFSMFGKTLRFLQRTGGEPRTDRPPFFASPHWSLPYPWPTLVSSRWKRDTISQGWQTHGKRAKGSTLVKFQWQAKN